MRRIMAVALFSLFGLLGCGSKPAPVDPSGIVTKNIPEEIKFKREYMVRLNQDIEMTIKADMSYNGSDRTFSGELTQTDNRYVFFDPEKPAERILDQELVPLVVARCKQIMAFDATQNQQEEEVIDSQGRHWKLVVGQ